MSGADHCQHQPVDRRGIRAAIAEIADENRLAPGRRLDGQAGLSTGIGLNHETIAELIEQRQQFLEAAMNIADDIERSMLIAAIDIQPDAVDRGGIDFFQSAQDMDVANTLALELAERSLQLLSVSRDHARRNDPMLASHIGLLADVLVEV